MNPVGHPEGSGLVLLTDLHELTIPGGTGARSEEAAGPGRACRDGEGAGGELIPPRALQEPLLPRRYWALIGIYGILIALAVLAVFWLVLGRLDFSAEKAVTVSFLTLSFSRLWHLFNMRDPETGVVRNEIIRNPLVWAALGLCILLLLLAVYWPGLSAVLSLVNPGGAGWLLVLAASLSTLVLIQFLKSFRLLPA